MNVITKKGALFTPGINNTPGWNSVWKSLLCVWKILYMVKDMGSILLLQQLLPTNDENLQQVPECHSSSYFGMRAWIKFKLNNKDGLKLVNGQYAFD